MKIGQVANRTGVTLRTVRYYQSLGLIQCARRTKGGVHLYSEEVCRRIELIRDLRSLDVPLERIRGFLDKRRAARTGDDAAKTTLQTLTANLAEVERRMARYEAIRLALGEAIDIVKNCLDCPALPVADVCCACPVVTERARVPAYFQALMN